MKCAGVKSCPLFLVLSVPSPSLSYVASHPVISLHERGENEAYGAGGRPPYSSGKWSWLNTQSAPGPLLLCQLALAQLTAFWEGVSELQLA